MTIDLVQGFHTTCKILRRTRNSWRINQGFVKWEIENDISCFRLLIRSFFGSNGGSVLYQISRKLPPKKTKENPNEGGTKQPSSRWLWYGWNSLFQRQWSIVASGIALWCQRFICIDIHVDRIASKPWFVGPVTAGGGLGGNTGSSSLVTAPVT